MLTNTNLQTREGQTELSLTLSRIDNARRNGKVATVVMHNDHIVVKVAAKTNVLKRAYHYLQKSGEDILRRRVMNAASMLKIGSPKFDPEFDPLLKQQLLESATRRHYSFLSEADISTIQAIKLQVSPSPDPKNLPPNTDIKTRVVAQLLPDISYVNFQPVIVNLHDADEQEGSHTTPPPDADSETTLSEHESDTGSTPAHIAPPSGQQNLSNEYSLNEGREPSINQDTQTLPQESTFKTDQSLWATAQNLVVDFPEMPQQHSKINEEFPERGVLPATNELLPLRPIENPPSKPPRSLNANQKTVHTSPSSDHKPQAIEKSEPSPDDFSVLLDNEFNKLDQKPLKASLADTRLFLDAYYNQALRYNGTSNEQDKLYVELEKHFKDKHQFQAYKEIEMTLLWVRISLIRGSLSETDFKQLMGSNLKDCSRIKTLRKMVSHTIEVGLRNPPHIQGHPCERITKEKLEFLELVEDTDKLMDQLFPTPKDEESMGEVNENSLDRTQPSQFSPLIYDVDEADTLLPVTNGIGVLLNKLKLDVEKYCGNSTSLTATIALLKNINPFDTERKALKNNHLTNAEIDAVIKSRYQLMEMEKTLGQVWDKSVLVDKQCWCQEGDSTNEDAYNAYIKMLRLSKINTPQINSAHQQWLMEQNTAYHHHPKVVVEASNANGLLSALTQFEAGADVTLVRTEQTTTPGTMVRLDPLWIETLRFYLPKQFDDLFGLSTGALNVSNTKEKPGTIHADGFGEISADVLEQFLLSEIKSLIDSGAHFLHLHEGRIGLITPPEETDKDDTGLYRVQLLPIDSKAVHSKADSRAPSQKAHNKTLPASLIILSSESPEPLLKRSYSEEQGVRPENLKPSEKKLLEQFQRNNPDDIETIPSPSRMAPDKPRLSGQCAWKSQQINNEPGNFTGLKLESTKIDEKFITAFHEHLTQALKSEVQQTQGFKEKKLQVINRKSIPWKRFENSCLGENLTTHFMEAPHHISIEMELPDALRGYMSAAELEIAPLNTDPTVKNRVQRKIQKAWFQAVADGFDLQNHGVISDHIHPDSVSFYSRTEKAIDSNIETLEHKEQSLFITAIGDPIAQPVLPGSERTSAAREQIQAVQKLTRFMAQKPESTSLEEQDQFEDNLVVVIDTLNRTYDHATQFLHQKFL